MKNIILILFLFISLSSIAQPDTIINRYATNIDAGYWPSVNEGDYIFFSRNGDGGNSIYSKGTIFGITLPIGKKVFIWRGSYWRIKIEGSDCVGSAANLQ